MFSKELLCLLLFFFGTASASGELLIENLSPSVVNWQDPSDPSPVVNVGVSNPNDVVDLFPAFAITARVVRQVGATGSVEIRSIVNTLDFGGHTIESEFPPGPSTTKRIDVIGLAIPSVPATSSPLVDLDFVASPDAHGLFDVELLPFQTPDVGTYWTNGLFEPVPFENTASAPLLLATISVGTSVVPEPHSLSVWLSLCVLFVAWRVRLLYR